MLMTLLSYFVGGVGFMAGVLVLYTIYDFAATRIMAHQEAKRNKGKRRRRH